MNLQAKAIIDSFRGFASSEVYFAEQDFPHELTLRTTRMFGSQALAQYTLWKLMTNDELFEDEQRQINKIAADAREQMRLCSRRLNANTK